MQGDEARPFSPTVFPAQPVPEGFNRGAGIHKPFSSPTQTIVATGSVPHLVPTHDGAFYLLRREETGGYRARNWVDKSPRQGSNGSNGNEWSGTGLSGFEMGNSGYNLYNETREIS